MPGFRNSAGYAEREALGIVNFRSAQRKSNRFVILGDFRKARQQFQQIGHVVKAESPVLIFRPGGSPSSNIHFMNPIYCNDQAYIAESYLLDADYIHQMCRLAFFKINSYKLSVIKASFCRTKDELEKNLRSTLLNYKTAKELLCLTGFQEEELLN